MLQQYPEHRKTASKQWIYACITVKISAASEYSKILQVKQWHSIDTQEFLADAIFLKNQQQEFEQFTIVYIKDILEQYHIANKR